MENNTLKDLNALRVAIYKRVSTEEQKKTGFSLEGQEDELRAYAERK